jgi:hypothetical protein
MGEMYNAISGGNQGNSPPTQRLTQGSSAMGIPNLEEELSIDKTTLETLKALYSAKERAV